MEGLSWSNEFLTQTASYLGKIPGALLTLLGTYLIIKLVKKVIGAATQLTRVDPTARSLVMSSIGAVGWVIGIAATLNALGLQQISLALGGSVALVAMALATGLNTVSQDLLAGIYLLADEDFAIGAVVRTAGLEGEIIRLSIRKTKLRDAEGYLHAIPNRNIDGATYTIIKMAPVRAKGFRASESTEAPGA